MSLQDLRDAMKKEKLVFGTAQTIKNLKKGTTKKIFLASNCGDEIENNIKHYAKMNKIEVIKLDKPRAEISVFCRKNFPVSVISY
jgi:ribosomal protein L30E